MAKKHALTKYRNSRHMSLEDLAKTLGVTRTTVSRWEKGQRKIDDELIATVADVTSISIEELRPDLAKIFKEIRRTEPA